MNSAPAPPTFIRGQIRFQTIGSGRSRSLTATPSATCCSTAGSGYVRDRDLEFTESRRPSKGEVLRKFDEAIALVLTTLDRQSDSNWTLPYSAERQPDATNRIAAFLRCVVHLDHHVGQIIYLSRELQKN